MEQERKLEVDIMSLNIALWGYAIILAWLFVNVFGLIVSALKWDGQGALWHFERLVYSFAIVGAYQMCSSTSDET